MTKNSNYFNNASNTIKYSMLIYELNNPLDFNHFISITLKYNTKATSWQKAVSYLVDVNTL